MTFGHDSPDGTGYVDGAGTGEPVFYILLWVGIGCQSSLRALGIPTTGDIAQLPTDAPGPRDTGVGEVPLPPTLDSDTGDPGGEGGGGSDDVSGTSDCPAALFSRYVDPRISGPELHIFGVFESTAGQVDVTIDRPGEMTLVLSAFDGVDWRVLNPGGATIELVILNGFDEQQATVPAGVPIDDRSPFLAPWLGHAITEWDPDDPVVEAVEAASGLATSTFWGCFEASAFTLGP